MARLIDLNRLREASDKNIEWLIVELRKLDSEMPGGVVSDFSHNIYLKIDTDAYGHYRSGEKKVDISIIFKAI